jgi:thiamine biosynthesis lipoprotein
VAAARDALHEADRIESALTVFRDSDLVHVNRSAGDGPVAISPELFALLARCRDLHADTGGAFDITSTPLSRAWGFLARAPQVPSPDALDSARARVGMEAIDLRDGTVQFVRTPRELNLGSIGKGYAVQCIADALAARGVRHALISAGTSSVVALGGRGEGWPIDICSRQLGGARLARLHLRNGALGTSGAGEQFVDADGRRYGHVLDPRTGWPAAGVVSASVVHADGATADALATACLVGGLDLACAYCAAHPDTLVLITPAGGQRPVQFGAFPGALVEDL